MKNYLTTATVILCLSSLFATSRAFSANKVCGKVNVSNNFFSKQWQDAGDGSSCFGVGMVDVIVPTDVKFKLKQNGGAKCSALRKDNTIRITYSLDADSSENCQLFLTRQNGAKATVSILAPIGS